MAFGFPTGGGNIVPRIKYDARSGRLFRVDRVKGADGNWASKDADITTGAAFLVARASLRKGWRNFKTFDERLVPLSDPLPARPDGLDSEGKPEYRPVVKMLLKLAPQIGGDVRELSISAATARDSIETLVTAWSEGDHATDDECPVVRLEGTSPLKLRNGTAYVPSWKIAGWRPMPADLAEAVAGQSDLDEMAAHVEVEGDGGVAWDEAPVPTEVPGAAFEDDSQLPF